MTYHEIPEMDEQIVAALNRIVDELPGVIGTCDEDSLMHLINNMHLLDNVSEYMGAWE